MHIAFLTPEYPHAKFGPSAGLGTSIKNLAYSLNENGISVTIFVHSQRADKIFEVDGINFIGIQQKKYPVLGWFLYRKYLQNRVNEAIKDKKIDLIEAPDWIGITAFMKLNAPLILRLHGSDTYFCHLEGRRQKFKNRFFERRALKSADKLISVSEFTTKVTKKIFAIQSEIEVIPNGLVINNFLPAGESAVIKNRILYFGTIIRKKGILELAEIFNLIITKNPTVELLIIGKDVVDKLENISTMELFKSKLSLNAKTAVKFIKEIPYTEIKKYIASAQVVVLPSFAEALPMTWLEAMAMEKALVTSDIGWAKEVMIDGKTGFTVSPENHLLYAEKIIELLRDSDLCKEMGKNARIKVLNDFSSELIADKNIQYYNSVISKYQDN